MGNFAKPYTGIVEDPMSVSECAFPKRIEFTSPKIVFAQFTILTEV